MSKQKLSRSDLFSYSQQNRNEITSFKHKSQPTYKPWVKKPINKCLQNNLVYAMYLPVWFEDQEVINRVLAKVIKSDKYFGKYGAITSVISSFGDSQKMGTASFPHLQSYITYSNQKEAALAISAVNQITYESKIIRTTYGTNKLCSSFGKTQKCVIRNCFYLHDQKDCINIQGPLKTDFEKQKFIAYQTVKKNLVHFVAKIQQSKQKQQNLSKNLQDSKCKRIHFPSIKQTIDILIAKNILTKAQYQYAYQQYLDSKKKMSQTVKNIVYIRYRTKPNAQPTPDNKLVQNQIVPKIETKQSEEVKQKTFQVKKKILQSQFLMRPILQSLDEDQQEKILKQVDQYTPIEIKQFQSVGLDTSLMALYIYWQLHEEKENHFDDQLQTEESQTASCSKEGSHWTQGQHASVGTEENILNNRKISYSVPQQNSTLQTNQQCPIFNRLKEKISKNPLAKMSKFQFVPSAPSKLRKAEYQKVTNILRSNLIK